jgi:hypothetical protein
MSDGLEERDFKIKLRDEILGIGGLAAWIGPSTVLVRDTADALFTETYKDALIVIHNFTDDDDPHAFGISGELIISCFISVSIRNSERANDPLPADQIGISEGPSLAVISGLLRNEFAFNTLGSWCMNTELGTGIPIIAEELPDGYVGRRYPFMALKEVQRS